MRSEQVVPYKNNKINLLPGKYIVFLLLALMIIGLIYLYPKKYYQSYFTEPNAVSETSLAYLKNLSLQHKENVDLQAQAIQQLILMGYIDDAKEALVRFRETYRSKDSVEKANWLNYIIQRELFFRLKLTDADYLSQKKMLVDNLNTVLSYPNHETDLYLLAKDALALDEPQIARHVFGVLIRRFPEQPPKVFAEMGQFFLGQSDYENSALYYFKAQEASVINRDKISYFFLAVQAIEASGNSKKAFEEALVHARNVKANKTMNVYLTKLALQANRPKEAQIFILRVILE